MILGTGQVADLPSRYKDDLAFWLDGREIAHFESDQVLDLRLTIAVRQQDKGYIEQLVWWAIEANRESR